MSEIYDLFRRNFPYCVREEKKVRHLLEEGCDCTFAEKDADGKTVGAAVVAGNNILLLCVDHAYRGRGIGTRLLKAAEEHVRAAGYDSVTVGAGASYIMPGIPTGYPVVKESLCPDRICDGIEESGRDFVAKRGYLHAWDCNCFDMRMQLRDFCAVPWPQENVEYRWAAHDDIDAVIACTDDAHRSFSKYYASPALYEEGNLQKVLIATRGDEVLGALIVSFGTEKADVGSAGCTAVRHAERGQGIAARLVIRGTEELRNAGLQNAFVGYTYTGLDALYGYAGYRISTYYYMARKEL